MLEDNTIVDALKDESVVRIVKATNFKGYRLKDGSAALGYDMKDGSYLVVRPADGMGTSAAHPGWEASKIDASGAGLKCSIPTNLHDAMVQTFKIPSPIYGEGADRRVADAWFDGEEVSPEAALAEAKRLEADAIVTSFANGR